MDNTQHTNAFFISFLPSAEAKKENKTSFIRLGPDIKDCDNDSNCGEE